MITTEKTAYADRLVALSCSERCLVTDDKARAGVIL